MSAVILLVEGDSHCTAINRKALTLCGYCVSEAASIREAKVLFKQEKPDLIVLDVMLPDGNGLALCKEIRRKDKSVPVLFLSALGQPQEVVAGFKAGGDDYLAKPYDVEVLVARVEALLRRTTRMPETLLKGALKLRITSDEAFVNGENLNLSQKEFSLLFIFVQCENQTLSVAHLYEKVWGQPMGDDNRSLKTILSRLRGKLEGSGYTIISERGEGYCFEEA